MMWRSILVAPAVLVFVVGPKGGPTVSNSKGKQIPKGLHEVKPTPPPKAKGNKGAGPLHEVKPTPAPKAKGNKGAGTLHEVKPTPAPKAKGNKGGRSQKQVRPMPAPKATPNVEFGRLITVKLSGEGSKSKADPRFGPHPYALSGFSFNFRHGDRRLKRVGVGRAEGRVRAEFQDQPGTAPFEFAGTFRELTGIVEKHTPLDRRCQVACELEIDRPAKDEVFVLTGFVFMRPKHARAVHRIAVHPLPQAGVVRVELDDGHGPGPKSEFKAMISYAYIPKSRVKGHYADMGGTDGKLANAAVQLGAGGRRKLVLQGFDLQFSGHRHFVHALRVKARRDDFLVSLQDKSKDDPFHASIEYVVLR